MGLFTDGIDVFTSHRLSVTPTIGFFIKSKETTSNQDQRDNQGLLQFFVNSIFSLPHEYAADLDQYYIPLVDELLFLCYTGVSLEEVDNPIKVAALFVGSDLKQKKQMNRTPTWVQHKVRK